MVEQTKPTSDKQHWKMIAPTFLTEDTDKKIQAKSKLSFLPSAYTIG